MRIGFGVGARGAGGLRAPATPVGPGAGAARRARAGRSTRSCTRRSAPARRPPTPCCRDPAAPEPGPALAIGAARPSRAAATGTAAWSRSPGWPSSATGPTRTARAASRARGSRRAEENPFPENPGLKPEDVVPSLQAIILERRRAVEGDSAVLADILGRLAVQAATTTATPGCSAGSARARRTRSSARFRSASSEEFKVRYLTLLSYFTDPQLIPLLARVYAAPDSFGLPKRYAIRASDGLLWIGTRESLQALLDARAAARARGVYADPGPAARRPRFSGERQLVGDQSDGEVADGRGWRSWSSAGRVPVTRAQRGSMIRRMVPRCARDDERRPLSSSASARRRTGPARTPRRTPAPTAPARSGWHRRRCSTCAA